MPVDINLLPRTVLETWLRLARLPLQGAEALANRGKTNGHDSAEWGPMLAFDAFEANVKDAVGSILRDDRLRKAAAAGRERVEHLRQAVGLQVEADQRKAEAQAEFQDRREAVDEKKAEVAERKEAQEARLEREEREAKQRVREQAQAKERVANEARQKTEERIGEQERLAEQRRLQAEREALAERKAAVEAKGEALKLDKAVRATKAKRKNPS